MDLRQTQSLTFTYLSRPQQDVWTENTLRMSRHQLKWNLLLLHFNALQETPPSFLMLFHCFILVLACLMRIVLIHQQKKIIISLGQVSENRMFQHKNIHHNVQDLQKHTPLHLNVFVIFLVAWWPIGAAADKSVGEEVKTKPPKATNLSVHSSRHVMSDIPLVRFLFFLFIQTNEANHHKAHVNETQNLTPHNRQQQQIVWKQGKNNLIELKH